MFLLATLVILLLPSCISSEKVQEYTGNGIWKSNHLVERMEHLELQLMKQIDLNKKQSVQIEGLQKEVNQLQVQCGIINNVGTDNQSSQNSEALLEKVEARENRRRVSRFILDDVADTRVGFTAYLDHKAEHLGINQIVVFNKVLFNDGGMYNNGSGIFTCPVDGVYMFFFEISSDANDQIVAKLVVNGVNKIDGIADTSHSPEEAQGSNMALLRLTKGTHVSVENYRWGEVTATSSSTDRFNSFSGILLYQ